jgi:hypothetical protein
MDNTLRMYVPERTPELGDPEAHRLLCECFPRDVEAEVATSHEVLDEVSTIHRQPNCFHVFDICWRSERDLTCILRLGSYIVDCKENRG